MPEPKPITPDRWRTIGEAYWAAHDPEPGLSPSDRGRLAFQDDPEIATEVASLLSHEAAAEETGFLDPPPVDVPEPQVLTPGTRVGPYELLGPLGRGGMGAVYLARRVEDYDQFVALKLIGSEMTPSLRRRFHAERQILATLKHPNIVRLLDGGETDERVPYLVMDYVDGLTLDRYCDEKRPSFAERARLVRSVCRAVAHAHELGILHRDLKPQNVLVNEVGVAMVTDFGLARTLRRESSESTTGDAPILGTPAYMAPEQIRGEPDRDSPAADCYGLGATLYRLLTGVRPFEADTPLQICLMAASEEAVPVRKCDRSIPRDLETIVAKAMAREPRDRFDSAGAMAGELDRFLDGLPLTIRPPSPWTRLAKWTTRHRAGLITWCLTFAALLVTATAILFVQNRRMSRALDVADGRLTRFRATVDEFAGIAEAFFETPPRDYELARRFVAMAIIQLEGVLHNDPEARTDPDLLFRYCTITFNHAQSLKQNNLDANRDEIQVRLDSSIAVLRSLIEDFPDHPRRPWFRFELARSLRMRGAVSIRRGQPATFEEELSFNTEAFAIVRSLRRDAPDKLEWRDAESNFGTGLSQSCFRLGRYDEGMALLRESLKIAEQLSKDHPERLDFLRNVEIAELNIGDQLEKSGRRKEAEAPLRRSVAIARRMVENDPANSTFRLEFVEREQRLGRYLFDTGRFADAEVVYMETLMLGEALAFEFSKNESMIRLPPITLLLLGDARYRLGKLAEAEADYRRGIERMEELIRIRPNWKDLALRLILAYENCSVNSLRNLTRSHELREMAGFQSILSDSPPRP